VRLRARRHFRVTDRFPFSAAAQRNAPPILELLRELLRDRFEVLEVGSGTGQHAVHFAAALPHLRWQASDRAENLPGIRAWLAEAGLDNTPDPLLLDVNGPWPRHRFDAVYSANTLHIMSWEEVIRFFSQLPDVMTPNALLIVYGPFNRDGAFTSPSNADFDAALRASAPHMGIRDIADVDALAQQAGLEMLADHPMPANNRCVVWRRRSA
jgi:cyclopropane fatty-acyl-phospholipid synthase-like methyltransferase